MVKHIITCPVLQDELKAVKRLLDYDFEIHIMDYNVHASPAIMHSEISKFSIEIESLTTSQLLLVGDHCESSTPLKVLSKELNLKLPTCSNCIELILGKEKTLVLQQNRTSIMTPGWMKMINHSIETGNWRVEDVRINLGWYDRIIILDTGLFELTDDIILEFYELIQVPIEIVNVDLEIFKSHIENLLSN